jgi:hypothetical protein
LVPSLVAAQSTGNGLLSVYVQVINSDGNYTRSPGDFTVLVAGNAPSPSTFNGSQSGVQVSLAPGNYSVAVSGNQYSYIPSYSTGCTGNIGAGQTALCVITMGAQSAGYQYPTVYPYPFSYPPFTCVTQASTVGLRQNVSFEARGGVGGTYNWQVPGRSYPNAGPVLTVSFDNTGTQLVTVTNATQTATCSITVNNTYYPQPTYPTYPTTTYPTGLYPNTIYPTTYQNYPVTATYQTYPRLPNTGVEPLTAAQVALALTLLAGVAIMSAPYVRKAFIVVTR